MLNGGIRSKISRAKLRRMFKYLLKVDKIIVRDEYNNSLGHYAVHEHSGKLIAFIVDAVGDKHYPYEYQIKLSFKDGHVYEDWLPVDAYFTGFGQLEWINSGPYCYFTAKKI